MPSDKFEKTIAAIVCCYNEARTIERVISDLLKIPFLSQIIVVDDGSSDNSRQILQKYKEEVTILFNASNKGKGCSVARALEIANCDIILLLDADIINYTAADLKLLVEPVMQWKFDFSVKVPDSYFFLYVNVSGIRCYWRKDLLPLATAFTRTSKYGIELFLNKAMRQKSGVFIKLSDYRHTDKFQKYPFFRAVWEYGKEAGSLLYQIILTSDRGALYSIKKNP